MSNSQKAVQDKDATSSGRNKEQGTLIRSFFQYLEDSKRELSKVSWPTKSEIKVTGLAVIAMIFVMAIFLGFADFLLVKIVAAILSIGA